MPRTVQGVVSMAVGEPVTMENVVVPDPGPGRPSSQFRPVAYATRIFTTAKGG